MLTRSITHSFTYSFIKLASAAALVQKLVQDLSVLAQDPVSLNTKKKLLNYTCMTLRYVLPHSFTHSYSLAYLLTSVLCMQLGQDGIVTQIFQWLNGCIQSAPTVVLSLLLGKLTHSYSLTHSLIGLLTHSLTLL